MFVFLVLRLKRMLVLLYAYWLVQAGGYVLIGQSCGLPLSKE
jgi:hypothetical protein